MLTIIKEQSLIGFNRKSIKTWKSPGLFQLILRLLLVWLNLIKEKKNRQSPAMICVTNHKSCCGLSAAKV